MLETEQAYIAGAIFGIIITIITVSLALSNYSVKRIKYKREKKDD